MGRVGARIVAMAVMMAISGCAYQQDAPLGSGAAPTDENLTDKALEAMARGVDGEALALEAVRRHPDDPQALLALAMAYDRNGKGESARDTYRRLLAGSRPDGEVAQVGASRRASASDAAIAAGPAQAEARFAILRDLVGRGLATQEEYERRRAANIGALLPFSEKPAAAALDWPPPGVEQVAQRLQALGRSLESGAITPQGHALERNAILEALLPAAPQARRAPPAPPGDAAAAAAEQARLQRLRQAGLITPEEMARERAAIERLMPSPESPRATPLPLVPADGKPATVAPTPVVDSDRVGVHLASLRSEVAARRGWDGLRKRFPKLLGGLQPEVKRVEIPAKGVFYRLSAGPLSDAAAARGLCRRLQQRKQFCRALPAGG